MSQTTIFDTKNILRSLPYKAVTATVDKDFAGEEINGKKYIKAGTLVAGKTKSIFEDRSEVVTANATKPDGIVLYDTNLEDNRTVSVVYAGEVYTEAVNNGTVDDAVKAALPLVKFISGGKA